MYTLYYLPGACSLATQVVLHELNQAVDIVDIQQLSDFSDINPVATVPVLIDGESTLREGAAILLYLLNKHPSHMLPTSGTDREQAIENILFANATRVIVKSGVSALELSSDLVNYFHLDSIFEFNSSNHLCQIAEAA